MKKNNTGYLFLIDHDGTLCQTSGTVYESIKYAAYQALNHIHKKAHHRIEENNWEKIFSQTAGTTEKKLIGVIASYLNIPPIKYFQFELHFYQARSLWYKMFNKDGGYIYDTYYPDAIELIQKIATLSNYHSSLVTGNPSSVIKQRLAHHLQPYFQKKGKLIGSFGEEGLTREELIKKAIKKCEKSFSFQPIVDSSGYHQNVYYLADSEKDFFAGLRAKVKMVWIPSRDLRVVKDYLAKEYVQILKEFLGEYIHTTNNLLSPETLRFLHLS